MKLPKIWLIAVTAVIAGAAWHAFNYKTALSQLDLESAQRTAIRTMEKICAEQCQDNGVTRDSLRGPILSPVNFTDKKHYEFLWTHPSGVELLIVIADAGWNINLNYWWVKR